MPKTDTDSLLFTLRCLSSATQNGGKIDFKGLGTTFYNGATGNAVYLRLGRIKKSVDFTDVPIGATPTAATTVAFGGDDATNTPSAAATDAFANPYAPTVGLPVTPKTKTKRAPPSGGRGKKRKLTTASEDEVEGGAQDEAGGFEAVNDVASVKKQKRTPLKGKKGTRSGAAGIDMKAASEAAAAFASAEVPIPAFEDVGKEEGVGGEEEF